MGTIYLLKILSIRYKLTTFNTYTELEIIDNFLFCGPSRFEDQDN